MRYYLAKTLSGLGLRPNNRVLDRISSLALAMRNGNLPADLRMKASGLLNGSADRDFVPHPKLDLLLRSLASHHKGTHRLHDEVSVELASYAISYFWEELDNQPDHGPEGLADDWMVIDRIFIPLKHELDDYRLWSRRRIIQESWGT